MYLSGCIIQIRKNFSKYARACGFAHGAHNGYKSLQISYFELTFCSNVYLWVYNPNPQKFAIFFAISIFLLFLPHTAIFLFDLRQSLLTLLDSDSLRRQDVRAILIAEGKANTDPVLEEIQPQKDNKF